MNEIKGDLKNGKLFCVQGLEGSILLSLPKLIFSTLLIKIPANYFITNKFIPKFTWKGKKPKIANNNNNKDQEYHSIPRFTIKPQQSRQHGIGDIIGT